MKFEKWMEFREDRASATDVERILQSANAAVDKAFTFLFNSIKKSYGGSRAMHAGMRDELMADLKGIMRKISTLEPKVARESLELIDKALVIEQEVLGVPGRDVGGKVAYNPERILMSIRDHIKNMIRDVVVKVSDIKVAGATGKTARELASLRGTTQADIAGLGKQVGEIPGQITPGIEKIGSEMGDLPGKIAKASRPAITHDESSNITTGLQAVGADIRNLRRQGYLKKEDATKVRFYTSSQGGRPIEMSRKNKKPIHSYNPYDAGHNNKLGAIAHDNYGILYVDVPGAKRRVPMDLKDVHGADAAIANIRSAVGGGSTGSTGIGVKTGIPPGMHRRGADIPIG